MADFVVDKDPNAILDYGFDWRAQGWLPDDDNIASSKWILDGLELIAATESGTTATFTTASEHHYTIGHEVFISGVTPDSYNSFGSPWVITSLPSDTTFTVTLLTGGLADATDFGTANSPAGLRITMVSFDDDKALVWLSRGVVGQTYAVTNRITTEQGRTEDRTFKVNVKQR